MNRIGTLATGLGVVTALGLTALAIRVAAEDNDTRGPETDAFRSSNAAADGAGNLSTRPQVDATDGDDSVTYSALSSTTTGFLSAAILMGSGGGY